MRKLPVLVALLLAVVALGACGSASPGETNAGGDRSSTSSPEDPVGVAPGPDRCGLVEPPADDSPDASVSFAPCPKDRLHGRSFRLVEPSEAELNDVRPIPWQDVKVIDGGTRLIVIYYSGVEPCNVLDRVEVTEASDRVEVAIYEGSDPRGGDVACIELAEKKGVEVTLEDPLGDRKVVDGAA